MSPVRDFIDHWNQLKSLLLEIRYGTLVRFHQYGIRDA